MAIYHCTVKMICRSNGQHAVRAAAYRSGSLLRCLSTGKVFNHLTKREVVHSAILSPGSAPGWTSDREELWNNAEIIETRKNSQIAREIEVSLPVELTLRQQINLIEQFLHAEFVQQGILADYSIHHKQGNPHCHVMLPTREIGPTGFGQKRRDQNGKDSLLHWRKSWADFCNQSLAAAGVNARIDHRSLKAQGIERQPTLHLGPDVPVSAEIRKSKMAFNDVVQAQEIIAKIKTEEQKIQQRIQELHSQILDLDSTVREALASREQFLQTVEQSRQTAPTLPPGFVLAGSEEDLIIPASIKSRIIHSDDPGKSVSNQPRSTLCLPKF